MPTIFILFGFRFSFFSNDHEPIHVHVYKGDAEAKIDILPKIKLVSNHGFKKSELKIIEAIAEENKEIIIQRWFDYFNNK